MKDLTIFYYQEWKGGRGERERGGRRREVEGGKWEETYREAPGKRQGSACRLGTLALDFEQSQL